VEIIWWRRRPLGGLRIEKVVSWASELIKLYFGHCLIEFLQFRRTMTHAGDISGGE
jgi:hypothetical protein